MFCSNCGCKLEDDAVFCPECGAKVVKVTAAAPKEPVKDAASQVKNVFAAAQTVSVSKSGFSTLDLTALAAAVLALIFSICSIRIVPTWIGLIACAGLVFLCLIKDRFDSMLMVVPITVFAVMVLVSSIRSLRYARYLGAGNAVLVVISLLLVLAAAVIYWLMVFGKSSDRKVVVAEIVCLAAYALFNITPSIAASISFRVASNRLMTVLFMIAYILRIVETSKALATADDFAGRVPHPYLELGGYLKFTVYGGIIVCVLAIIGMIVQMVQVFKLLSMLSRYANVSFIYILAVILLLVTIVLYGLIIRMMLMIKARDQRFLWFYHKMVISLTLVNFVLQWVLTGFGSAFLALIFYALMFFLYTLYFVRSVRVRTYMQSDEYLRIDPLTKNVQSPTPAA